MSSPRQILLTRMVSSLKPSQRSMPKETDPTLNSNRTMDDDMSIPELSRIPTAMDFRSFDSSDEFAPVKPRYSLKDPSSFDKYLEDAGVAGIASDDSSVGPYLNDDYEDEDRDWFPETNSFDHYEQRQGAEIDRAAKEKKARKELELKQKNAESLLGRLKKQPSVVLPPSSRSMDGEDDKIPSSPSQASSTKENGDVKSPIPSPKTKPLKSALKSSKPSPILSEALTPRLDTSLPRPTKKVLSPANASPSPVAKAKPSSQNVVPGSPSTPKPSSSKKTLSVAIPSPKEAKSNSSASKELSSSTRKFPSLLSLPLARSKTRKAEKTDPTSTTSEPASKRFWSALPQSSSQPSSPTTSSPPGFTGAPSSRSMVTTATDAAVGGAAVAVVTAGVAATSSQRSPEAATSQPKKVGEPKKDGASPNLIASKEADGHGTGSKVSNKGDQKHRIGNQTVADLSSTERALKRMTGAEKEDSTTFTFNKKDSQKGKGIWKRKLEWSKKSRHQLDGINQGVGIGDLTIEDTKVVAKQMDDITGELQEETLITKESTKKSAVSTREGTITNEIEVANTASTLLRNFDCGYLADCLDYAKCMGGDEQASMLAGTNRTVPPQRLELDGEMDIDQAVAAMRRSKRMEPMPIQSITVPNNSLLESTSSVTDSQDPIPSRKPKKTINNDSGNSNNRLVDAFRRKLANRRDGKGNTRGLQKVQGEDSSIMVFP